MEALMKANMKNELAHNIAQQLLSGKDIYEYLGRLADFLFMLSDEGDVLSYDDVHEIYLHAYNQGKQEADYIVDMYERYNIQVKTQGHGGSQITPAAALEKYFG